MGRTLMVQPRTPPVGQRTGSGCCVAAAGTVGRSMSACRRGSGECLVSRLTTLAYGARGNEEPCRSLMGAPLDVFFHPRNVAVIGATEEPNSVGRSLVSNLKQTSFGGRIYPVNPKRSTILELPCFASLHDVPERVDLAVIATPAHTVPGVV